MSEESLFDRFERAHELTGEEREKYLQAVERDDSAVAKELRELLVAAAVTSSVLERTPIATRETSDPQGVVETEVLPSRVGPYRVLRELGRGGMGRVFLAEQVGEDFRRQVAVKRLDRRHPSAESERRFRDEVKFLAALEHPGIARFFDGGREADGSAYLALEFVEGVDLVAHANGHDLSVEDRIGLFLEVLDAVAFAHERRIVHRDLKPGNVLVGRDGHAKLLDFGISKLLDPEAGEAAVTRTELRAFTPAYASPEQIRGGPATVASDIYSLGVVLYELLSGVRPFRSLSGDPAELERAVLERDPEPPSTAARRERAHIDAAGSKGQTGTALHLGRDLDAICLKALRKEPRSRYAAVDGFAADLRRLLGGLPVEARRGGISYRSAKYFRRHRVLLAAAAITACLAAVVALMVQRVVAHRELAALAATVPRPALSRIGALSARFADSPDHPEIGLELIGLLLAAGRGTDAMDVVTRLRQLPDPLGKGIDIDLAEAEAALAVSEYQRAAGSAQAALAAAEKVHDAVRGRRARLLHSRSLVRLSQPEEAEKRLATLFAESEGAGDAALAAECLVVRAAAALKGQRTEDARRLIDLALPRVHALGALRLEVEALVMRARLEGESGHLEEALTTIAHAHDMAIQAGDLAAEASSLVMRSAVENWHGDDAAALETLGLAVQRLRVSGNREQLLIVLGNLAITRIERSEFALADEALGEADPIARDLASPVQRGYIFRARGYLDEQRGDTAGARAAYEAAVAAAREAGSTRPLARYLAEIAWLEEDVDRPAECELAAREALAIDEKVDDARSAIEVGAVLAWAEARRGDAGAANRRLAAIARAAKAADSESATFHVLIGRAMVAEALGDFGRAVELRRVSLAKAQTFALPTLILVHRHRLARALDWAGTRGEAVKIATDVRAEAERIGMRGLARDCQNILDREKPPSVPATRG